jgi:hypothetical protein
VQPATLVAIPHTGSVSRHAVDVFLRGHLGLNGTGLIWTLGVVAGARGSLVARSVAHRASP